MSTSGMNREEFAKAVAAAISGVQHLYREVDRLLAGLRDSLAEEPSPLAPLRGTLPKAGRDQSRLVVRNEYGTLFAPIVIDDEDVEDEEDDEGEEDGEDVDEEDGARGRRKRPPAEIAADQPLLAVRVAMYDPQRGEAFEPQIQFAVMNEWTVGKGGWSADQRFVLARYMLRRIPRILSTSTTAAKGSRVVTRATVKRVVGAKKGEERRIGCRLPAGVEVVPLYTLDSAEGLDRLASAMKTMWRQSAKAVPGSKP